MGVVLAKPRSDTFEAGVVRTDGDAEPFVPVGRGHLQEHAVDAPAPRLLDGAGSADAEGVVEAARLPAPDAANHMVTFAPIEPPLAGPPHRPNARARWGGGSHTSAVRRVGEGHAHREEVACDRPDRLVGWQTLGQSAVAAFHLSDHQPPGRPQLGERVPVARRLLAAPAGSTSRSTTKFAHIGLRHTAEFGSRPNSGKATGSTFMPHPQVGVHALRASASVSSGFDRHRCGK